LEISSILENASNKLRLKRERYIKNNIPSDISNVVILPFFGEKKEVAALSSLFLKRHREIFYSSKYFILLSWPGMADLFPYVNEYWSVSEDTAKKTISHSDNFSNNHDLIISVTRGLNYFFENVISETEISDYFKNGFTKKYMETFKNVKVYFPSLPSSSILGQNFIVDMNKTTMPKVVLYPSTNIKKWVRKSNENIIVPKETYLTLAEKLLENNIQPLVIMDYSTYDLSSDLLNKAIYLKTSNVMEILAAMRSSNGVLDLFSGISRFASIARVPFVSCLEKNKFYYLKEYEIEDLCSFDLDKKYMFSFSDNMLIKEKDGLNFNLIDGIIAKLKQIVFSDKETWPSTQECDNVIKYDNVRKIQTKKFGINFVKPSSLQI